MKAEEIRYPSVRFFLFLLGAGCGVGLALLLLRAPFWLYCIAPILTAPLVVWELKKLDTQDQKSSPAQSNPVPLISLERSRLTARVREHWLAGITTGALWAAAAAVSLTLDASLTSFIIGCLSLPLLIFFVWQVSTPDLLVINQEAVHPVLFAAAEQEMDVARVSVLLVQVGDRWLFLPRDAPSDEFDELVVFDTEEQARVAADEYVSKHGGEVRTLDIRGRLLLQQFERELDELEDEA